MKPTRGSVLAGLVFVAVAAPVAAYAVRTDDAADEPTPAATHGPPAGHGAPHGTKPDHATGSDRADEASGPGRAHAEAMKEWARCVAEAASGPKAEDAPIPSKEACEDKPVGPGRAKHAPAATDSPGRHGRGRGHGHGHTR